MHIFELFFHKRKGYFLPLALCLLLPQGCVHAPQNSNPKTTESTQPEPNTNNRTEICPHCPIEVSQLLRGLLLTSPERSTEQVLEGRRILQHILESEENSETAPYLRMLASTRLEMLDTRQSLTRQLETTEKKLENAEKKLETAEKKIRELLDIESSIESNRQENEGKQAR